MKIPVTIIVPIYKVEPFLRDCLESITNQTYRNFQCILVDDCSPDNCGKICDEYVKLDNRFLVVHKEKNEGLSEARNTGLDLIEDTDYVCFIDSDDFVHPQYLEILYNTILQTNTEIVECKFYPIEENTTYSIHLYSTIKDQDTYTIKTGIKRIEEFFKDFSYYMTMNKIYDYKVIKNYRFYKDIWFEDVLFNNEIYLNLNKVLVINDKLYFYRQRQGSITNKRHNEEKGLDILDVWFKTYELYKNKNINKELLNHIANFLWDSFFFECRNFARQNNISKERSNRIYKYFLTLEKDNLLPSRPNFIKLYFKYKSMNGDILKFFNNK